MKFAKVVGNFNGQVILTLFYFTIVLPFGLISRIFGDALNMKWQGKNYKTNFSKWEHPQETLDTARKPF